MAVSSRARLFASTADEARSRRAGDVIALAAAVAGLVLLGVAATRSRVLERALITLGRAVPDSLDGLWLLVGDVPVAVAILLLIGALVRGRVRLAGALTLAGLLALGASTVLARVVHGTWPALVDAFGEAPHATDFAAPRLAIAAAIVFTCSPYVTRPVRRVGSWSVLLAALATFLHGAAPTAAAAAVVLAVACAAVVHLAFGSSRGRPSLDDVASALRELGVPTRSVAVAGRQRAGVFLSDAVTPDGEPLVVKVYGRDAQDTQRLSRLWRAIWFRPTGVPLIAGRQHLAEHEALLTMLAAQAGILAQPVITAGVTSENDVLLVLRPVGVPVAASPDGWTPAVLDGLWAALSDLHAAGIAHGQVDADHVFVEGGRVGLSDFGGAAVTASPQQLGTDRAQALVTTALAVGIEPAVEAAVRGIGCPALAEALGLVQTAAMTPSQRARVRADSLDLGALRERAAATSGSESPELLPAAAGDLGVARADGDAGDRAPRARVGVRRAGPRPSRRRAGRRDRPPRRHRVRGGAGRAGRRCRLAPRSVPTRLAMRPLYVLQLGMAYIGLAVPTTAGRVAVNIRFFQRHGLPPGAAIAIGGLEAVAGIVVQAVLIAALVLLTPAALDMRFDTGTLGGTTTAIVVGVVVAVAVVVLLTVRRWRRFVLGHARVLTADALAAARGLRSPRRLGLLVGGAVVNELLLAASLGIFLASLGCSIEFDQLLLIGASVTLLAVILPIPGGIGVIEGGLTYGLVAAGLPEEPAFAAVLMYRLATFYLPPIWGFFALRWLERNELL